MYEPNWSEFIHNIMNGWFEYQNKNITKKEFDGIVEENVMNAALKEAYWIKMNKEYEK